MARRRSSRRARLNSLQKAALILLAASLLISLPAVSLRWVDPPVSAFMLQHEAAGVGEYQYQWNDWQDLGSAAALAVMAAEDQNFPDHHGFDLGAIRRAVSDRLQGQSLRGASTISQQVAKNLFLWPGRSLLRKVIEAWFTAVIEVSWPKRRILEVYLNIAEFGPGVYGIPAASRVYFGKRPAQLTDAEAALLAAVLPNPLELRVDRPSSYVLERQRWIMEHSARLRSYGWLGRLS
ncbi:MAG: monofunctional biosynthetic peptidoglycan transglycosylase [Gammaproteobacteria bacterium]|jgi:monofunctional biosynthetic peptidoglycan transglycosylase